MKKQAREDLSSGERFSFEQIGIIRSCYPEKFGIPRQSGLVEEAEAEIILLPPYNRDEMVKGLEAFSHIWVHFIFHQADHWRSTIRPPGLGGKVRVGIFASRSPHRPNRLGMSAVLLKEIQKTPGGIALLVQGGDFLDKTPVVDVKPYLSYVDAIADASTGYSGRSIPPEKVVFTEETLCFCAEYRKKTGRKLQELIEQVLFQDPRPANQRGRKNSFGMMLWDVNVCWKVAGEGVEVVSIDVLKNVR